MILLVFLILYQMLTSPNIDRILPLQFEVAVKKGQEDISFIINKKDERYHQMYDILKSDKIKWYMNIASVSIANITLHSENMNILFGGFLASKRDYLPIIIQYQPKYIGKGLIELQSNLYIKWDIQNNGKIYVLEAQSLSFEEELKRFLSQILALLIFILASFLS